MPDGTNIKKHWKPIYQPSYLKFAVFVAYFILCKQKEK